MSKSKGNNNKKATHPIKSTVVAGIVGCSDSTVRQARAGTLPKDGDLYKTIMSVDRFTKNEFYRIIKDAKKLLKAS